MSLINDYANMLKQLLPMGSVWNTEKGSVLSNLLEAIAKELSFAHTRAEQMSEESKAHLTSEMLEEWETETGLPTACSLGLEQSFSERRDAVVAQLTSRGGQSKAYFTQVAKELGYDIEIIEYRPFIAGLSQAGHEVHSESVRFIWKVQIKTESTLRLFRSGASTANEPLGKFSESILECIFNHLKPAHTTLWFEEINV